MRWIVWIFVAVVLCIVAVGILFSIWKPWVPRVEMIQPGDTGRRVSADGLVANYYPAIDHRNSPAILLLGGSDGGLARSVRDMALSLQESGFAVLQITYYRAPGQPKNLELISLETFFRGIDWLAAQPGVDADRMGIVGHSKGAEAALMVAVRRPGIRAVVVGAPSSVAWSGINWSRGGGSSKPSWSMGGEPLPALPYGRMDWRKGPSSVYKNALQAIDQHQDAIIPVEETDAPIMLVCGEADTIWPSCTMARQIVDRAASKGGPATSLLTYKDAGHFGFGVPLSRTDPESNRISHFGGTHKGNVLAREDSWPRIIAFLQEHLASATDAANR